jgi:hypothetical protein
MAMPLYHDGSFEHPPLKSGLIKLSLHNEGYISDLKITLKIAVYI